MIEEKKINLDADFARFDPQRTSKVRAADFQRLISGINPRFTPEEVYMLGDEFDQRREGLITYQSFINQVEAAIDKKRSFLAVLQKLEKHCLDKSINFEDKLKEIDPRNLRKLSKEDLLSFLNRLQFQATPLELNTLISELPKDKDLIDLADLIRRIPKPKVGVNLDLIFQKIKTWIHARKLTISQAFAEFDKNRNGYLSPYELSQALTQMGITGLSAEDITIVVQAFDKDKDGRISLSELSEMVGIPVDQIQTSVSQDFFRKIARFLKNCGQTLMEFFKIYDTDRSNSIDRQEFDRMIALMRIELDPIDVDRLFIEIDVSRSGNITFLQFMNKYETMIATIDKKDELNKEKIKRALKGKKPGDVFKLSYDRATSEQIIPAREFRQGLEYLGANLTSIDLDCFIQEYEKNGQVLLKDFAEYFDTPIAAQPQKIDVSTYQTSGPKHWAEKYFSQIRDYATRNRCTVREALVPYCQDRNGMMVNDELSNALNMLTMDITPQDIDRLARELRRDGKVSISDLSALAEGRDVNTAEKALEEIKSYFEKTNKKIEEVFRVDSNENIYRPDIVEGLKIMNVAITPNSLLDLIHLLNPESKELNVTNPTLQKITRRQLMNRLKLREPTVVANAPISNKVIEEKLKKGIYAHMAEFVSKNAINLEKTVFGQYDKYGTNRVATDDFIQICQYLTERSISQQQLKLIIDEYDSTKSGNVNYQAFINQIEEAIISKSFSDKLIQRLKRDISDKRINLKLEFSKIDGNSSGHVTFEELVTLFNKNGIIVPKDEMSRLCSNFDHDVNGKILYHDLLGKLIDVQDMGRSGDMTGPFATENEPYRKDVQGRQEFGVRDYQAPGRQGDFASPPRDFAASSRNEFENPPRDSAFQERDYGAPRRDLAGPAYDYNKPADYPDRNQGIARPPVDDPYRYQKEDPRYPAPYDPRGPTNNQYPSQPQDPKLNDPRNPLPAHWADRYFEIIKSYMNSKRYSVKDCFKEFDLDRSNSISSFEFSQALQKMGVNLNQTETQNLMSELDSNRDGRISITEFERILGTKATDTWAEEILKDIKDAIRSSGISLRELFLRADRDRNNFLSYQELMAALVNIYPRIAVSDLERLVKYLDIDNDGRIFYPEFLAKLDQENVEEVNLKVSEFLSRNSIRLEEVMSKLDYTGDKCIHINQMIQVLDSLRLPINPSELTMIVTENSLHRTRDNRLSYVDLVERLTAKKSGTDLLYQKIKETWDSKNTNPEELFRRYDIYNETNISPQMFYEALTYSGVRISNHEYTQLLHALPKSRDGKVLYKEFISRIVGGGGDYVTTVYAQIKKAAELKRINLLDVMRNYDTYGDKMIAKNHFKTVCDTSGITISDKEIDAIWADLDKNKSGLVNYEDLFKKIVPHLTNLQATAPRAPPANTPQAPQAHWGQTYLNQVKNYIKTNNMNIKQLFSRFDADHSNTVSPQEFEHALQDININMPAQDMQKLITELDIYKDGNISLTSFESLFPELAQEEKHITRLLYQIRVSIASRSLDINTIFGMKDRDYQGSIPVFEFVDCIKQICPEIGPVDLRKLSDSFENNGKIFYQEFIRKLDEDKVGMVNIKVRDFLTSRRISLAQAFGQYDPGDHFLTPGNIRKALELLGLPITSEELTTLVHDNNLSRSQDNRLSIRDLINRIGVREILPEPKPTLPQICEKIRKD